MGASRWDPSLLDLAAPAPDPSSELSRQLRFLIDREGLTPRQLAAEPDVPYTPAMLYRFFTGQELPPRQLIEVVARRCGGDLEKLRAAYAEAQLRTAPTAIPGSDRGAVAAVRPDYIPAPETSVAPAPAAAPAAAETAAEAAAVPSGAAPTSAVPTPTSTAPTSPAFPPRPVRGGSRRKRSRRGVRPRVLVSGLAVCLTVGVVLGAVTVNAGETERSTTAGNSKAIPLPPAPQGAVPREPKPDIRVPQREPVPSISSGKKVLPDEAEAQDPPPAPDRPPAGPSAGGLITNSDFTGTVAPWQATPGLAVSAAGNKMQVSVPGGSVGTVNSNSFALQANRGYVLRFEAGASVPGVAAVIVQYQQPNQRSVFAQRLPLSTAARPFAFPFTALTPGSPAAIVTFQFPTGQGPYAVTIDNVSLRAA